MTTGAAGAHRMWVAVLVIAVLTAACGTRRPLDEIAAAAGPITQTADGQVQAEGPPGAAADVAPGADAGLNADGGAAIGAADAGGADASAIQPVGGGAAGAGSGAGAGPGAGADGAAASDGGAGAAKAQTAQRATGSPMRIGVVGTLSGVGGTQRGSAAAVQAWAQWRNTTRGGLSGHPVEVLVVDDGGDPARFRSALQELVEQRGVVAFVGNPSGFTLTEGAVQYLEDKGVPVVGGDRLGALWNSSPIMFPQSAAGDAVIWNHMLNTRLIGGKGAAVGWVTCQEAQICRDADRLWQEYAPALGLDVRYRAQVSVAQPNFTAECTRAAQAGVEYFVLGTDANSIRRLANDCARQGYRPRYAVLQTSDDQAAEPALDRGYYASATFPWVRNNTPATREFQRVMSTYAPQVELSAHASSGWVAAKLFERAAAKIGDKPTSEQILAGLWSVRNDDLRGLTSPLTFRRGKPAPASYCFFSMQIKAGRWATDSDRLRCRAP